jgi:RND family efflux transporter MFP subunit
MNKVYVVVSVPEDVFVKLQINQPAEVTFDSMGAKKFIANIAQLNPSADPLSRQFTVKVILDNKDKKISAGMFGKVNLQTGKALHVLTLPLEAIKTDTDGNKFVTLAKPDGKDLIAEKVVITTGINDDKWVEVTSAMQITDKVVTMSATTIRDGQKISQGREKKGEKKGPPSSDIKGDPSQGRPTINDEKPTKDNKTPIEKGK